MHPQVVSFQYTLRNDDGEVIDTSGSGNSVSYLEGAGTIIDGLENALRSMQPGDRRRISLAPEVAYGTRDDKLVRSVERALLPVEKLNLGDMFQAGSDQHAPIVRVVAIEGDSVTLDANHPLAGQRLHFEVEVVAKREATPEEIDHGHVHGPGGHHHH